MTRVDELARVGEHDDRVLVDPELIPVRMAFEPVLHVPACAYRREESGRWGCRQLRHASRRSARRFGPPLFALLVLVACGPGRVELARPTAANSECQDYGFGGYYLERESQTPVYLIVDMPNGPSAAATAAAETVCAMGSPVPTTYFEVRKVRYTLDQLHNWRQILGIVRDEIGPRRLLSSGTDVINNRVHLDVDTERASQEIEARMPDLRIPADAVFFNVRRPFRLDDPPVQPTARNGFELAIEVDRPNTSGATSTTFHLVLTNGGAASSTATYNSAHPVDVAVFAQDGRELWKLLKGPLIIPGGTAALAPGESVTFDVEWNRRDNDGDTVAPGTYLVRGFMSLNVGPPGHPESAYLATAPQVLELTP